MPKGGRNQRVQGYATRFSGSPMDRSLGLLYPHLGPHQPEDARRISPPTTFRFDEFFFFQIIEKKMNLFHLQSRFYRSLFFCLVTFLFIILGKSAFYFRPQMWYDTITNIAPFFRMGPCKAVSHHPTQNGGQRTIVTGKKKTDIFSRIDQRRRD